MLFAALTIGVCSNAVGVMVFRSQMAQFKTGLEGRWLVEAAWIYFMLTGIRWTLTVAPSRKTRWLSGILLVWSAVIAIQVFHSIPGWGVVPIVGGVLELMAIALMLSSDNEPSGGLTVPT